MIWSVVGLAGLMILAAVLMILRRRSEPTAFEHPRIEPTTRPSWAQPLPDAEPPLVPEPEPKPKFRHAIWMPTLACGGDGEFIAQILEASGNYSIRGRNAVAIDCELKFLVHVANAAGDAFVGGIPLVPANDIEVTDASLEEVEGSYRDRVPLRPVIFTNDTRLYLGIVGREFRPGPTYRLRFQASYEAATD